MIREIEELQKIIDTHKKIVFFGGAGVSTESGIPDFRSQDGLYNLKYKYPPEQIISHSFFVNRPDEFYRFYKDKMIIQGAKPNAAHLKLARWEKEGKLKGEADVVITDLPGIYSLSPYTLEEVVARNYLVGECPEAILNIVDGTNLERNLYLTTQLIELGIPVVVAINMIDIVEKNGDEIDLDKLSRYFGCKFVRISALKGTGIEEAANLAIEAAKLGALTPSHVFSGTVEHALAHIEEAVLFV